MEVSRTMLNTFSKILREIANTTLQPRVVNSKVFYFRGVEILLKKPPKVKGSFQESWGYDYIMIVPVCIIVVFCNPFRNICTELNNVLISQKFTNKLNTRSTSHLCTTLNQKPSYQPTMRMI